MFELTIISNHLLVYLKSNITTDDIVLRKYKQEKVNKLTTNKT
jgi:hypothetical protein